MTALSSWEMCLKYALFVFNFVFWLAGTGVLAVGLWLRFDSRTAGLFDGENSPTVFFTGVYILIAAGALMMVVGFLGCCGAIKESPCMLGLFFFFLLIIFAVEVAAGIWGLSNKDRVVEDVTEFYKQTYTNYKDTRQEALKETLRLIHFGLDCCGPTGTVIDAAKDICPKKEGLEILITTSCPAAIDAMFNNRLHIIGGVGIGIGVIMASLYLFFLVFIRSVRVDCGARSRACGARSRACGA
uniref:Tetraspanin n=1 Tax=Gasterosteus aculeatus aculeatus TaxID=481459 RepID=A0AAQ4QVQ5_GASAC